MAVFGSRSRKSSRRKERVEPRLTGKAARRAPVSEEPDAPRGRKAGGRSGKARRAATPSRRGKAGKRRSPLVRAAYWSVTLGLWGVIAIIAISAYTLLALPDGTLFKIPQREPGIVMLADDGEVMARRGGFLGDDVRLEELPPYVPEAVVATEDHRFYSHFGVDPIGLARAMFANLKAGGVVQGGSTLTQQLAKNLFLEPDRTIKRKLQELVLALWLEVKFTKDEILQLYLNRVYFGGGSYGIEAAAQHYFDRSARELTLAQAATLAGLLRAPARYNPIRHPRAAEDRAYVVLSRMVEEGFITAGQGQSAIDHPAEAVIRDSVPATQYIADWVADLVPELIGELTESVIVETTVDPRIQSIAERSVRRNLDEEGQKKKVGQAAMVMLDPSGAVKAMVGGRSYKKSQFNRAVQAKRQPGSSFKPFVYLAALEYGFVPEMIIQDEPVRFGDWAPENYNRKNYGPVTIRDALARSLNTVAAKLTMKVGPRAVVDTAHRLGIRSDLDPNASIALGTSEVTLLELTSAYAPFANGGYAVAPHVIRRITTRDGELLYERQGSGLGRVVEPFELGEMNAMLRTAIRDGTGKRAVIDGQDAAGKTGTTQNWRDAWFVGYTAHLVAGVWVGNDDGTPTNRATGSGLPARIWKGAMAPAHEGMPAIPLPGGPVEEAPPRRPREEPGLDIVDFLQNLFGGGSSARASPPDYGRPRFDPAQQR